MRIKEISSQKLLAKFLLQHPHFAVKLLVKSMENHVRCTSGGETVWLPLREGFLPIESLQCAFPGAVTLQYRSETSRDVIMLRQQQGYVYPPQEGWGLRTYQVLVSSGSSTRQAGVVSTPPTHDLPTLSNSVARTMGEYMFLAYTLNKGSY